MRGPSPSLDSFSGTLESRMDTNKRRVTVQSKSRRSGDCTGALPPRSQRKGANCAELRTALVRLLIGYYAMPPRAMFSLYPATPGAARFVVPPRHTAWAFSLLLLALNGSSPLPGSGPS